MGRKHVPGAGDSLKEMSAAFRVTANKKLEPSASHEGSPYGNDFCQQSESAWKQIHHHLSLQMGAKP